MGLLEKIGVKSTEQQAIDAYNRALEAKYAGDWKLSLEENQRANELRPKDEATLWNLGIAATALHDWDTARNAWTEFGIKLSTKSGEVRLREAKACVRINPNVSGEVVWGTRIDPARMVIDNLPLSESGRRWKDIVLNDGAQEGTRTSKGIEYPVFDELGLWQMSAYSTYEVKLAVPNEEAVASLRRRCDEKDIGVEDWGTMRILCKACSRGNPDEHQCIDHPANGQTRWGFAARSETFLREVLMEWAETEDGASVGEIELLLSGVS